ncbi:MAG: winged helix DNA-binding protein [Bacteroidota bacterium]
MKYQKVKDLLDYFGQFEIETGQEDLQAFGLWLNDQFSQQQLAASLSSPEGQVIDEQEQNNLLAGGIGILYYHSKHYVKTALKDSLLISAQDFVFLVILNEIGDMRKKELIDRNYLEFSSGMEVIRRLQRNKLISEYPDPDDKRSKRVSITELGVEEVGKAQKKMEQVSQLVVGNLQPNEKGTLINLVSKLLQFHHPIWNEDFGTDIENLQGKYLP